MLIMQNIIEDTVL